TRDWALEQRARNAARLRFEELSNAWLAILQSAVAAGIAWLLARLIVGQPEPFFAPAAAVISLGLSRGQPRRRAIELSIGVALGIGIAAALVHLIGVGALQVTVLVALVMSVSLLLNGSQVLINQAAVSALLIMTLPGQGAEIDRFLDACVGGAVAIGFGLVFSFHDPFSAVVEARRGALLDLAAALEDVAAALAKRDLKAAEAALSGSRKLDAGVDVLYDAVTEAGEIATFSPRRRVLLEELDPQADAAPQIDYAVRDARVLTRAATTAIRRGAHLDPRLAEGVESLAAATRSLDAAGRGESGARADVRERASHAVELAGAADVHNSLWPTMIFGQTRAIAFDLMQAAGEDPDEARALLDSVATSQIAPPPPAP
ncbi:MAG TPA: FUSC family protein, partial [Solirubrobacterales bacterium]|nr:FUSC family protein [Solirubrobacterales bacterium]